jgi:hypothetical protein
MGRLKVRIWLLPVIVVAALVASMSAGIAQAAPYQPSAQAASSEALSPDGSYAGFGYDLAPCTYPEYGPYPECESTSPVVDRWVTFTGSGLGSCTFTQTVNWGDGKTSKKTFAHPSDGLHLIASHSYKNEHFGRYVEIVSTVESGPCGTIPSKTFLFDYDTSSVWQAWWEMNGLPAKCIADQIPDPISVGLSEKDLGYDLGVFSKAGRWFVVYGVLKAASGAWLLYSLFKLPFDCAPKLPDAADIANVAGPPLPRALYYGVTHLGKRFKASLPRIPEIVGVDGYQKGSLYYFSVHYSNASRDAKGFGFVGVNGSGWAPESHPFSSPSYGIVGKNSIDYPFNLACGTTDEYKSQVEVWIYDSQGFLSTPVQIALTCTT